MKNVTLKDVARAAGVSYSTVSRSLSGSPQIGRETRERILRLCDEMGYTKNYVARSMVMRRTELIGLVVPSIDNQFMAELAYHAEMSARARGYNLMLCNSGPDLRQEKAVVKLLVGRQVDGMLIVPQEHQSCEELRVYTEQVPTVFLSEDLRDEPLSCVTTDNTGATYLAMARAVEALPVPAAYALVDGNRMPPLSIPGETIVKGDGCCASIAAASILAKVSRDRVMKEMDSVYPQYQFAKHKGYGTAAHYAALRKEGPSPEHRLSFLRSFFEKENAAQ